ncbi:hypothetical protein MTO96_042774, partial [Rhipicephalus appendiculatus]
VRKILADLRTGRSNEAARRQTRIYHIPENINPQYSKGRRTARTKAVIDEHVYYEDAWCVKVAE